MGDGSAEHVPVAKVSLTTVARGVASSRLHRIWRTTHPHRPAPSPVRRRAAVDRGEGVRGRHRHDKPPSRPRFDAAGHLLRLAPTGSGRRRPRRAVFHRPGPRPHPGPVGRLLGQPPADLDPRCGRRCRRRGSCGGARMPLRVWRPPAGSGSALRRGQQVRWVVYALLGGAAAATVGPYLVLVLVACGLTEIVIRRGPTAVSRFGAVVHPSSLAPWCRRSAVSERWSGWRSRSVPSPMAADSSSSRSCSTTPSRRTTG